MESDETTNRGFSDSEMRVLTSVLDEMIPPSSDGGLPGAGQLGVARYVEEALRKLPELKSMIAQGLSELDNLARSRNVPGFDALPKENKLQLLKAQGFILPLMFQASAGYYQNPRVAEALGLEPRPPHPKGYEMEPNDLSLLDGVRRRSKLYREC